MSYISSISSELITVLHLIDIICEWVIYFTLLLMSLHFIMLLIYTIYSIMYTPSELKLIDYTGSLKKYFMVSGIILLLVIINILIPSVDNMIILFN